MAREQRRLAAIVSADVVGYSRLMGRDESGTLARLREHHKNRLEPVLVRRGGRLVKLTGDGALVEFGSAVDALGAAIEFQQAMAEVNPDQPEDTRIVFRIGLHLGDLIVDGDDLYGDGVNVAARLEAEAPAGGIVISRTVHESVSGRLKAAFDDLGNLALKNIDRPVQAFGVKWEPADWQVSARPATAVAAAPAAAVALPDKPSIVVLPFLCPGGTPEQEAFADGVTQSLVTDLSRQSTFTVLARTTSLALKGKAPDVRELGRTLAVRYVLEGSIQPGRGRLRVNVQLISTVDGIHAWADRFDKEIGDLLDLQDEIAERISRAVYVQVREAELRRVTADAVGLRDPATLLLLGRRIFVQGYCRANVTKAAALYAKAIELDDRNASAHVALSIAKSCFYMNRWSDAPEADLAEAIKHRDRARSLDPNLPYVQVASAWILTNTRQYAAALTAFERAAHLGLTYIFLGRYPDASEALRQSILLTPEYDFSHVCFAAVSVALDRIADARTAIDQALSLGTLWTISTMKEGFYRAALGVDNARLTALWDGLRLLALRELERVQPEVSLAWVEQNADAPAEQRQRMMDGLRLAGLQ